MVGLGYRRVCYVWLVLGLVDRLLVCIVGLILGLIHRLLVCIVGLVLVHVRLWLVLRVHYWHAYPRVVCSLWTKIRH